MTSCSVNFSVFGVMVCGHTLYFLQPLLSPGESFTFHSGVRIPTTEVSDGCGDRTGDLSIGSHCLSQTGTFTGSLEIGTEKKKVESTVEVKASRGRFEPGTFGCSQTASDSNHSSTMDIKRERLDVRYRK